MPVKNVGKYLHECLLSIREQTFTFWELIVVNDHSVDETADILQAHAALDPRIRLLHNTGQGITPALQMALEHSRGPFITRMDGDDLMPKDRLEIMFHAIKEQPQKTVVTGLVSYFSQEQVSKGYRAYEHWLNERVLQHDHWQWVYRECVIASPNWMMHQKAMLNIGGFAPLSYPEDYHLVLKWYEHEFDIVSLPKLTLHWREHTERTSRISELYDQQHFFQLKVAHFLKHTLGDHQLVLWGSGKKGKLTAALLKKHKQAFRWMDMTAQKPANKNDQPLIGHYRQIERLTYFKLLISVYPPAKEKVKLEAYLKNLNLHPGKDYWYL